MARTKSITITAVTALVAALSGICGQAAARAWAPADTVGAPHEQYSPTTLIVTVDEAVGKGPLLEAVRACGATVVYNYRLFNAVAVAKPEAMTIEQAMAHFAAVEGVTSVARDRVTRLTDPVRPRPVVK